jgi:LiaI-LiaF-like transmembrane region
MASMTEPTDPGATEPTATPPPPQATSEWRPPRGRESNTAAIVVGLIFLAIGIWFFLDRTLGLTMPDLEWENLWPVILILIGGVMIFRAATAPRR